MSGTATSKTLIDNDRVVVTEWRFAARGENTGWHRHEHDYVVVPLLDGRLDIDTPTGRVSAAFKAGEPYYRDAGVEHDVINGQDAPYAFLEIEIKKS
jgi:mannose-6-phosphate isomerase-like protein (cupin superfamily)